MECTKTIPRYSKATLQTTEIMVWCHKGWNEVLTWQESLGPCGLTKGSTTCQREMGFCQIIWQSCQGLLCCERLYTDLQSRLWRNFLICCKVWDCSSGFCTCSTSWLENQSTRCQNHLLIWWARWRNLYGAIRRFYSEGSGIKDLLPLKGHLWS